MLYFVFLIASVTNEKFVLVPYFGVQKFDQELFLFIKEHI